jgi:hypothetical protein
VVNEDVWEIYERENNIEEMHLRWELKNIISILKNRPYMDGALWNWLSLPQYATHMQQTNLKIPWFQAFSTLKMLTKIIQPNIKEIQKSPKCLYFGNFFMFWKSMRYYKNTHNLNIPVLMQEYSNNFHAN